MRFLCRDLVDYQDGSIVSCEIVKKPTGNVTIFAFDEGQDLSEHTAPFDALAPWNSHRNCGSSRSVYSTGRVHVLEGEAEISIAGQPQRLHCGGMILMPAQQPHALKALKRFKMILTMIRS